MGVCLSVSFSFLFYLSSEKSFLSPANGSDAIRARIEHKTNLSTKPDLCCLAGNHARRKGGKPDRKVFDHGVAKGGCVSCACASPAVGSGCVGRRRVVGHCKVWPESLTGGATSKTPLKMPDSNPCQLRKLLKQPHHFLENDLSIQIKSDPQVPGK